MLPNDCKIFLGKVKMPCVTGCIWEGRIVILYLNRRMQLVILICHVKNGLFLMWVDMGTNQKSALRLWSSHLEP